MHRMFDRVFVINLDEQPHRLLKITQHLQSHGTDFQRVSALRDTDVRHTSLVSRVCEAVCSDGMIGCHASHALCWSAMMQHDLANALILEDDARLTDDAMQLLPLALADLPDDWDVVFLGCFACDNPNIVERMLDKNPRQGGTVGPNLIIPDMVLGTHAYAVSNKGAKKLLELLLPIRYHVDWMINSHKQQLAIYSVYPSIAYQDGSSDSTLAASFPYIANALCRGFSISTNPDDKRDVAWAMSHGLFKVWPTPLLFNVWFVILCILIYKYPAATMTYIMIDIVFGQMQT